MNPVLLAFLTDTKEAINEFVHNLLLVAGGFLVGYLIGWLCSWAFGRYVLRLSSTSNLQAFGRPIGGFALALVVALLVFTGKGRPNGEGGEGKGTVVDESSKGKASQSVATPPEQKLDPKVAPPKVDIKPADVTLRVTILGGADVIDERFYLLEDDRAPKNFSDLKSAVLERKAKEKGKVMLAVLFPLKNALPREHPAVTQVGRWAAEDAGLDVVFPAAR
jgi:hypothetical protein